VTIKSKLSDLWGKAAHATAGVAKTINRQIFRSHDLYDDSDDKEMQEQRRQLIRWDYRRRGLVYLGHEELSKHNNYNYNSSNSSDSSDSSNSSNSRNKENENGKYQQSPHQKI